MERKFQGIFIPAEVWTDKRLNALEKMILMEIYSLDLNGGCFASNEYIAEFCQCSITKVSTSITKLKKLGFLYQKSFDGRTRKLSVRLSKFERQIFNNCKAQKSIIKENKKENIEKKYKGDFDERTYTEDEIKTILSNIDDTCIDDL